MENIAEIPNRWAKSNFRKSFGIDTAVVLFFLATDLGMGLTGLGISEFLSLFTIGAFIVFSYFLPSPVEKPELPGWIATRLFAAAIGFTFGMGFKVIPEVVLMENLRFLPMTFLIFTGILCAATQIRGIIRVRLAG